MELAAATLHLQDPSSFSAAHFKGPYAFALTGSANGNRGVIAGNITSDGTAAITGASFGFNNGGALPGTFPSLLGRRSAALGERPRHDWDRHLQDNGGAWVFNLNMYVITDTDVFLLGSVLFNPTNSNEAGLALGMAGGEAIAAPGPFSNASLSGASVMRA